MFVFIIADTDNKDIVFRIATESHPLSPVFRIEGKAPWFGGNPYSLYGDKVKEYLGLTDWKHCTFRVASITSGKMID